MEILIVIQLDEIGLFALALLLAREIILDGRKCIKMLADENELLRERLQQAWKRK